MQQDIGPGYICHGYLRPCGRSCLVMFTGLQCDTGSTASLISPYYYYYIVKLIHSLRVTVSYCTLSIVGCAAELPWTQQTYPHSLGVQTQWSMLMAADLA